MEPIKTEYKNILFDSKSEAVFARALDLARHDWVYHPPEHCGHVWDFMVDLNWTTSLIEYKPAMPTNTYVDNLTELMRKDPFESIVVWGNPWDGVNRNIEGPSECCYRVYPIFCSYGKYGWGDFCRLADTGSNVPVSWRHPTDGVIGIYEEMVQEAKNYRFDLA